MSNTAPGTIGSTILVDKLLPARPSKELSPLLFKKRFSYKASMLVSRRESRQAAAHVLAGSLTSTAAAADSRHRKGCFKLTNRQGTPGKAGIVLSVSIGHNDCFASASSSIRNQIVSSCSNSKKIHEQGSWSKNRAGAGGAGMQVQHSSICDSPAGHVKQVKFSHFAPLKDDNPTSPTLWIEVRRSPRIKAKKVVTDFIPH